MPDPCRDLRGALGAAALGGIDPADEIALRAHLDGCPACRAELRDLTAVAQALGAVPISAVSAVPPEPSGELIGRVLERLDRERGEARSRRVRRVLAGAVAFSSIAAAIVAVVLVVGGANEPSGTVVAMPGLGADRGARATATMWDDPAGTEVEMKVEGLHPGDYYWLWVTGKSGKRVAAGTFQGSDEPMNLRLTAALPLSKARRIWVTDEKDRVVLDAPVPVST